MQLIASDGYGVELRAIGYQFPDASDERMRRSWLMIEGTGFSADGTWSFCWQALTPDEAVVLSGWLRRAAAGQIPVQQPGDPQTVSDNGPYFTEPNLALTLIEYQQHEVVLRIGLDLEFSPPWRKHIRAGDPFTILCRLSFADLIKAAENWNNEIAPFPP